jgi:hypothetical protein
MQYIIIHFIRMLSVPHILQSWDDKLVLLANNELKRIWKEEIVA